jgi:PhnB protein
MAVRPIPEGYHTVTPYLIVDGAAKAIDFYTRAFGAKEVLRLPMGDRIGHAEVRIGDSHVMLADPFPERDVHAPGKFGGSPVSLMLYVEDVDAVWKRALAAGGVETRPLRTEFYGDRTGTLKDPFGHAWTLSMHVEDVSPEEMERRMKDAPG